MIQQGEKRVYDVAVLIDTWWNVNILVRRLRPGGETGFNRYMVECE